MGYASRLVVNIAHLYDKEALNQSEFAYVNCGVVIYICRPFKDFFLFQFRVLNSFKTHNQSTC